MDNKSKRLVYFAVLTLLVLNSCTSSSSSKLYSSSEKVSLELYYESLCPYCSNFIVNDLVNIFKDGLISIVDLKLVPYGNAKILNNSTITCQHGPDECLLNTVEACALYVWPQLSEHFPFIYCVESLVYVHKYAQWETCFEKLGLDPFPIINCMSSGYGKKLELEYAAETSALEPPHEYVPWVVVNGQPLYEDYDNFESYICKAYNGTAVPKACSKLVTFTERMRIKMFHSVCDGDESARPALLPWIRSALTRWM